MFYLSVGLSGGLVGPLQLRPETEDQFYNLFFAGEKEKRTVMFDINGGKDSFSRPV